MSLVNTALYIDLNAKREAVKPIKESKLYIIIMERGMVKFSKMFSSLLINTMVINKILDKQTALNIL